MILNEAQAWLLLNFIVCFIGICVTVCRMGKMTGSRVKGEVRAIYLQYMMFFVTSGGSWMWGDLPDATQVAMSTIILGVLLTSLSAWRRGAPAHVLKDSVRNSAAPIHAGD